ncbi:unnamed protein product [Closterium sp. NIES-64]|nr:unnamed protein product [Closterium sp. NIES-64]
MPPPLPPPTHRHPPTPLQPLPQSPPPCPPLSSPAVHTAQHQVEVELYELGEAYRDEYLAALGVQQGGLAGLVQATYRRLGLRTYFTAREKVRGRGGERGGEMREEGCTARGNGHGVARGALATCASIGIVRKLTLFRVHVGMYVGMHVSMYVGMHVGVHVGMHVGIHVGIHVGVHVGMHVGVHVGMHVGVHVDVQVGVHVDII